jgi:acyl CoA:acetate/3-ketoacid CoA transferase beta subunit
MAGVRFFAETGGMESLPLMMRRRAVGQNTIVVNPASEPAPDQAPHANAPIVEMKGREDRIYAVVDMTATNKNILRGKRGVMLTNNRTMVVIQDELVLTAPGEILWTVYTPAEVELSNGSKIAKLTVGDKVLKCQIGGFGKAKFAAEKGILQDLTLSVESGGIGGLPAGSRQFGAMIGAGSIGDMSMQFDFYDGGGLDRCFMGALEMDRHGNVNAHRGKDYYAGVGGFCNITAATGNVIFCFTFSAKGLKVSQEDGKIRIEQEGAIPKIVEEVKSISFSGKKAIENGQNVLYITERCVFALRPQGIALIEVYPGIDKQKDILDLLPFAVIDET